MPLTPQQIAKIRQKEAAMPEAHRRSPLSHYFEGYYHITLKVRNDAPVLGYIEGHPEAARGTPDAPHVVLTDVGRGVEASWASIPSHHPGVELIEKQVMPDHFHGLLHLKPGNGEHLGRIVNGFMIGSSHNYWDTLGIDWRNMRSAPGSVATPHPTTGKWTTSQYNDRDHTHSYRGPALFVHGYNDVEAITPQQVAIKIEYIRSNPERRMIKGLCHDLFTIHRQQTTPSWTPERIRKAILSDRFFGTHTPEGALACSKVEARLQWKAIPSVANAANANIVNASAAVAPNTPSLPASSAPSASVQLRPVLDYVGDEAILKAPRKVSLVCHRADKARFEEQRDKVMAAARDGAVVVSAFISLQEREIKKQLLTELLPFIEIVDNGFPERYKPHGLGFYACAERRLVQVSCWTYIYQKEPVVTREMCLAMNELARIISGVNDDWWKNS